MNTGYYDFGDAVIDRKKVTLNYFKKIFLQDTIIIVVLQYMKYSYNSHNIVVIFPLILININNIFKMYKDLKEYFTYLQKY